MADTDTPAGVGCRKHKRRHRRAIAVTLATAAFIVPATAGASPSLLAQAKTAVQQTNTREETHHLIPFKRGTRFTITCKHLGTSIQCSEHAGPEQCVKGKPWILFSDLFPVIKGRLGQSLTHGLTRTNEYCTHS